MELKRAVVLVTGGTGGLGSRICSAFAREGARIAIVYQQSDARAREVVEEVRAAGGQGTPYRCDVTKLDEVEALVERIVGDQGRLDVLVNNAGFNQFVPFPDTEALTPELFEKILHYNTSAPYYLSRAAARPMRARGQGRIVNIASIASHTVLPGLSAYCGSKAAVAMLTRGFAREWARAGIAVNALCPGYIETGINDFWWPTEGGQRQLKTFPRRRLMDASDLDEAFLMLAGPAAAKITGSVITIDDGQSLPGGG